eukprot:scaffold296_cov164-Ochromonas_danica.AAC.6
MIWHYLPRDILHYVYSEWLIWSDLSILDIACLSSKDREEWLSSVSSLLMTEACCLMKTEYIHTRNKKLVNYYKWLGSRKVLVRDKFPMRLSVLEDLLHYCDPVTFCPALRSILILKENKQTASRDDSRLESSLSCFLSHCSHLEGVNEVQSGHNHEGCVKWSNILYAALNKHLQDNQLVKLGVFFHQNDNILIDKVGTLLSKHDKSLKELAVRDWSNDNPGLAHLLGNLIKSKHALRALDINMMVRSVNRTILPSLFQYLSSAGMFLETLKANCFGEEDISLSESFLSIGRSCPKLERLSCDVEELNSDEIIKRSLIYHLCPNLKYFNLREVCMIDVDEDKNRMCLSILDQPVNMKDSIECLFLALQRRPCTHVGLSVINEDVELADSEWSILNVLDRYDLKRSENCLSSIAEHGQNLTEFSYFAGADIFEYSEETICDVIRRCPLLEVLEVSGVGCQSILCAAQHLSRLRSVKFDLLRASEADIVSLLRSEDVRWPSCLRKGQIGSPDEDMFEFEYKPNSLGWHKASTCKGWQDGEIFIF